MPFAYYDNLSRQDRAVYRKSDALQRIPLSGAASLREPVRQIERALAKEDRVALQRASSALLGGITEALDTAGVTVRVLARRPSSASEELHGEYTPAEDKRALIRVWMRTAAHDRAVHFRTFVRTLLHELCHHLDYELYGLPESFHTEGFFKRESSLMRQLAPKPPAAPRRSKPPAPPCRGKKGSARRKRATERGPDQLELPIAR